MGLLSNVRGYAKRVFGRGTALRPAGPVTDDAAFGYGAPWRLDDYVGAVVADAPLEDHWAAQSRFARSSVPTETDVASTAGGICAPVDLGNQHRPEGTIGPPLLDGVAFDDFGVLVEVVEPWTEQGELDLPFFNPTATAAPVVADMFSGRHVRRVCALAALLARTTSIPHGHGRERAARTFEQALVEARWPGFFRSWLALAPSVECPHVLALAVELKEHWDDSPHLWRFRDAPGRPSWQHERARRRMSWANALAMAEARPHEPAWRILDEDLAADWEDLAEPCPGFWSLAEWFRTMCCGDEAEVHSLGLAAAGGRHRYALHLQEMCDRLGLGRTGAASAMNRVPSIDQDTTIFHFQNRHFRLGAVKDRMPTEEETLVKEAK